MLGHPLGHGNFNVNIAPYIQLLEPMAWRRECPPITGQRTLCHSNLSKGLGGYLHAHLHSTFSWAAVVLRRLWARLLAAGDLR